MIDLKTLIAHEDDHLLVLNKPNGIPVQTAALDITSIESLLIDYLGDYHIISRIDQVVSGLLLIAKDKPTASSFSKRLKKQQVDKTYIAIVEGHPSKASATLTNRLVKKGSKAFVNKSEGKNAILHYNTIKKLDNYTILSIRIETGRFHQIRCQLAHMGHPIKGDLKYGSRRSNKEGGIYLHCKSVNILEYPLEDNKLSIDIDYPSMKLWDLAQTK